MDLRRPLTGQWIAGLGGLLLIVSLWLSWYEITGPTPRIEFFEPGALDTTFTAWQVFDFTDWLLLVVGAVALSLPIVAAWQRPPAIPIALDSVCALVGIVGFLFVLFRFFEFPGEDPPAPFDIEREPGVWLALVAAVVIVVGAFVSMRSEALGPKSQRWQPGEESPVPAHPAPPPGPGDDAPESGSA